MIKDRAVDAVEKILRAASYDVEDGANGTDLSAYRGDECLVVLCSDDPDEINSFVDKKFKYSVNGGFEYCTKLLFTMKNVVCSEGCDCIVWTYQDLAKYAGQAVVAEIVNEHIALEFNKCGTENENRAGNGNCGTSGNFDQCANGGSHTEAYQKSTPSAYGGMTTLDDYGPELACLPEKITADRARQIAGIKGEVCRVYIPYYLYTCTSTGEKVCGKYRIDFAHNEKGLVNAVTGTKLEIDSEKLENVAAEEKNVSGGAKILDGKVKKSDFQDSILERVTEELTKTVRMNHSEGDAIYYEDKPVAPDAENIKITVEQVYLPVVQVRGDSVVEVDLFTGKTLQEPVDDGVEIF